MKNKHTKICPKCASTDVKVDFSNHAAWAYGLNPEYICNNCGYKGTIFPEVEKEKTENYKEEIKEKEISKDKKSQMDFIVGYLGGRFELLIIFGAISVYLIIFGAYLIKSSYFGLFPIFLGIILFKFVIDAYRKMKKN